MSVRRAILRVTMLTSAIVATLAISRRLVYPRPDDAPLVTSARHEAEWPYQHRTSRFLLMASVAKPLGELGELAEASATQAASMLLVCQGAAVVPVFICKDDGELDEVRRIHGVAHTTRRTHGAFYPSVNIIALVGSDRDPEVIAHEPCHWIVAQLTDCAPAVLEEGIAELVEGEVLSIRPKFAQQSRGVDGKRWRLLEFLVGARQVPTLKQLFRMDRCEFVSVENYALAWALAKVLVDYERTARGTLRSLLVAYDGAQTGDDWGVFARIYPADIIEKDWEAEVRKVAEGTYYGVREAER